MRRRVRQLLPAVRDRERGQGQRHARTGSHRGQPQERPQQQGPQQVLLQSRPEGCRGKLGRQTWEFSTTKFVVISSRI